jgi:hypothetical protein
MVRNRILESRRMKRFMLTMGAVLPLLSGVAAAQSSPEQSQAGCPPPAQGAAAGLAGIKISVDRGAGKGKIEIQCASGENIRRGSMSSCPTRIKERRWFTPRQASNAETPFTRYQPATTALKVTAPQQDPKVVQLTARAVMMGLAETHQEQPARLDVARALELDRARLSHSSKFS